MKILAAQFCDPSVSTLNYVSLENKTCVRVREIADLVWAKALAGQVDAFKLVRHATKPVPFDHNRSISQTNCMVHSTPSNYT